MEFDIEKIKAYYDELVVKRDEAVVIALANKDIAVAQAFEEAKANIEAEVIAKLTAEAEAPYKHDIELCEKFIKPAEVVSDNAVVEG